MFRKFPVYLLISIIFFSTTSNASPSYSQINACKAWIGRYEGKISASDSVSGEDVRIIVVIRDGEFYFAETSIGGGGFDGSSVKNICSIRKITGISEIGAGGNGRISMSLVKGSGGNFYFRLYNYKEGDGPNFAQFLPSDDTRILLHRTH